MSRLHTGRKQLRRTSVKWGAVASMAVLIAAGCGSDGEDDLADTIATTVAVEALEAPTTQPPGTTVQETTTVVETTTAAVAGCPAPTENSATQPAGVVASFSAEAEEHVEGIAVDQSGNVFVSRIHQGQLLKFAPGSGDFEVFGEIPDWNREAFGAGFLGLAVDTEGNVYGAAQKDGSHGVWKFDCITGEAEHIAGTEAMGFANSLAFDADGTLWATDSFSGLDGEVQLGSVWRIDRDGNVDQWFESALLGGTGVFGFPDPAPGANGIAYVDNTLIVANTEQFSMVSIPVLTDGSAGEATVLIEGLFPPDGFAPAADGSFFSTSIIFHEVVQFHADGTVDVIASGAEDGLDLPSSVAFGVGGTAGTLYVVNLENAPPEFLTGVGPALVAVDVETPGMPLPFGR